MLGNLNGPAPSRMQSADVYRVVSNLLAERAGDRFFILASGHADVPGHGPGNAAGRAPGGPGTAEAWRTRWS